MYRTCSTVGANWPAPSLLKSPTKKLVTRAIPAIKAYAHALRSNRFIIATYGSIYGRRLLMFFRPI
jgi:hypothetical protein